MLLLGKSIYHGVGRSSLILKENYHSSKSVAPKLPQSMSNIPWRKAGVKYAQNEIYFDIVEEIDATIAA